AGPCVTGAPTAPQFPPNSGAYPGPVAGPLVLVVDDDEPTRTLLRRFLTMEGYTVEEAEDGRAALASMERTPPELLLLDIMMPGQDGLDLLGVLRATSDVPIILLTAKDNEGDRVVGLRLGA